MAIRGPLSNLVLGDGVNCRVVLHSPRRHGLVVLLCGADCPHRARRRGVAACGHLRVRARRCNDWRPIRLWARCRHLREPYRIRDVSAWAPIRSVVIGDDVVIFMNAVMAPGMAVSARALPSGQVRSFLTMCLHGPLWPASLHAWCARSTIRTSDRLQPSTCPGHRPLTPDDGNTSVPSTLRFIARRGWDPPMLKWRLSLQPPGLQQAFSWSGGHLRRACQFAGGALGAEAI